MRVSSTDLLKGHFDKGGNLVAPRANGRQGARVSPLAVVEEAALASAAPAPELALITELRRDGKTQPRGGLNEDRVREYVEAKQDGIELPAVDVVFDGQDKWLWDGFHRVEAHLRLGLQEIAVRIRRGTLSDAQWLSYGANKEHGLNRTQEDKERAVRGALAHPNAAQLSNRQIARHCGVDEKTVRKYRGEMEATAEIPQLTNRSVQRGGQWYELPTENIGKQASSQADYAPVHRLESYIWEWLKVYQSPQHGSDWVALLRATRHANSPARPELEKWLKDLARWRRAELTQAIDNVRSQIEAGQKQKATAGIPQIERLALPWNREPVWPAKPAAAPVAAVAPPVLPQFKRETLSAGDRVAAVAGELAFWRSAVLHLALVGELTGQHSAVLALRREIEKVIQLYTQEGGYEKL